LDRKRAHFTYRIASFAAFSQTSATNHQKETGALSGDQLAADKLPLGLGEKVESIVYSVFMSRMLNANYSKALLTCSAASKAV